MKGEKVIIGSHNTMSYLTPKKRYVRLFSFFSKCQKRTLLPQLSFVDCVDLRVFYDNNGDWRFAHGLAEYDKNCDINLLNVLDIIEIIKPKCIVRLILEKVKYNKEDEFNKFIDLCKYIERHYYTITFIGGNYKKDWKQLYDFGNEEFYDINQFVSSMQSNARWYERFIPILYAKRMNKINRKNVTKGINLFDFI